MTIKYAVMYFHMAQHYMGPSVKAFDYGKWVAEQSHFTDIKEAEACRSRLLNTPGADLKPQNLQVIQIDC